MYRFRDQVLQLLQLVMNNSEWTNYSIINFKGAEGPMFKAYQFAPYIAVITISEFEPHSRLHSHALSP